jgi:hypothetical protein
MPRKTQSHRLPIDAKRELLELALVHMHLDRTWEGRELAGETHHLSELARQQAIELLTQLLDGKRPYLGKRSTNERLSARERNVTKVERALSDGAPTLEAAFIVAADIGGSSAGATDARLREVKRDWADHWAKRSAAAGLNHRIRRLTPKESEAFMRQKSSK